MWFYAGFWAIIGIKDSIGTIGKKPNLDYIWDNNITTMPDFLNLIIVPNGKLGKNALVLRRYMLFI